MKKIALTACLFFTSTFTLDITIETPEGSQFILEYEDDVSLSNMQQNVEDHLNLPIDQQEIIIRGYLNTSHYDQLLASHQGNLARKATPNPRNYNNPVTDREKKDIRYIVTTLSDKSLLSLLKHKSSLESAGDRINHVHPLRFLMCIFTDPEMKESLRGIYKRGGWVWSDFISGLNDSLEQESYRNNLKDEQVIYFAETIGINPNLIFPSIRKRHWTDFVVILIKKGNNSEV